MAGTRTCIARVRMAMAPTVRATVRASGTYKPGTKRKSGPYKKGVVRNLAGERRR